MQPARGVLANVACEGAQRYLEMLLMFASVAAEAGL